MSETEMTCAGRRGGVWEAIASALLPGLGQLMKGEPRKAVAVFLIWLACGISLLRHLPLLGTLVAVVGGVTWLYAVIDALATRPAK